MHFRTLMKSPVLAPHLRIIVSNQKTLSTLGFGDVLDSVLVTTTFVVLGRAAHSLPAEDFAAEQAHAGIGQVFAGCWAASFHHFVL